MKLDILNLSHYELPEEYENAMRLAAELALLEDSRASGREVEASLVLASSEHVRKLNARYRHLDKTTDVLSFPQHDKADIWPDGPVSLGDIVISYEQAKLQACEYGHSLKRELAFLTAHSMLHLMGYDHQTAEDESLMQGIQEKILAEAGIIR
ncbi:MAG: rRNA maturation RNase YbeY [Clostridiales bacterium]|jgi:probable rRNA maturation factor|nr:rRNA maturation RNase YbeY [Clostridiales bacterium]